MSAIFVLSHKYVVFCKCLMGSEEIGFTFQDVLDYTGGKGI